MTHDANISAFQALAAAGTLGVAFGVLRSHWDKLKRNPRRLPLPPGPKGLPVVGNLFQLDKGKPWETYLDWAREYGQGDLVYFEAMGDGMLVLNSLKAVNDLLDKRGQNYSDRVVPPSLDMMEVGWDFNAFSMTISTQDRFPPTTPVLEQHALLYLRRLLADPKDFMDLTKYLFGSIVMQISYGVDDFAYNAKLIDIAEDLARGWAEVSAPGRFLVDAFPILRYVPTWFPGAGWKRRLAEFAAQSNSLVKQTFDDALERSQNGIQGKYANLAADLIPKLPDANHSDYESEADLARNIMLSAYSAGVETTYNSGKGLFLALAMYPDVQRRAQAELDAVIGPCQLPKASDLLNLPYFNAMTKELYRWHTVAPLAVPHVAREDDEYNGYFIPKGTAVFGNAWAILHDPDNFENPMEFRPERYLKDGKLDAHAMDPDAAFGFGRRICPGRKFTHESVCFMAASLLSVFNIAPGTDAEGNIIPLTYETGPELIPQLTPFEVNISPRSDAHAALLSEV
ncbi:cytochrome P450 98A3 [Coprinopsis sp. MPI-PUGE-AT-0042]|nr:cytochrome P450 98A3 [Coprinopsis sp. MPI-PUGE-AT-0042]